jgi:hypothetical protein
MWAGTRVMASLEEPSPPLTLGNTLARLLGRIRVQIWAVAACTVPIRHIGEARTVEVQGLLTHRASITKGASTLAGAHQLLGTQGITEGTQGIQRGPRGLQHMARPARLTSTMENTQRTRTHRMGPHMGCHLRPNQERLTTDIPHSDLHAC